MKLNINMAQTRHNLNYHTYYANTIIKKIIFTSQNYYLPLNTAVCSTTSVTPAWAYYWQSYRIKSHTRSNISYSGLQFLNVSTCTDLKQNCPGSQRLIWYQHWAAGCGCGFTKPARWWREAAVSWRDIGDRAGRRQITANHSLIDRNMRQYCSTRRYEWIVNWHGCRRSNIGAEVWQ